MELLDRLGEEFDKRKEGLLIFAVLLGFGFFINQGVEMKGLYMDDLYLWSCYGEQSFTEFVFPKGSTRFRFVFYLACWLQMVFLGNHVEWMVPFNIVLNSFIAYSIYRIAVRMSGRKIVSLLVGIAYLLSRMSYYQIGQLYGLMESLGLWAALGMLYYTWRYMKEQHTGSYLMAGLLYFLASFIHERYMVLVPVMLVGLVFASRRNPGLSRRAVWEEDEDAEEDASWQDGQPADVSEEDGWEERPTGSRGRSRGRGNARTARHAGSFKQEQRAGRGTAYAQNDTAPKWMLLLITLGIFVLIQLIRFFAIGTLSPAGTGGTDVADTFKMADAIKHAWEQVAFVFGRNSGPDYLCILPFEDSPAKIKGLINTSNVVLGVSVAVFVVCCVRDREHWLTHIKTSILFLSFIALCIGSSSVTIRVEMRWAYVVYAAALLFLAYMSSIMGYAGVLVLGYVALMFPVETFYRENWDTLYLWPNQLRYNSLAEETVEKYGEDIFDKQVYIIGNRYEMSEFTAETFLKVYDTDGSADNTTIKFIDSDFDFREIPEEAVILWEDEANNAYKDVTEFVKQQRFHYAYGSYPDGWVDEHAKIVFLNEDRDVLKLGCYYPGELTGKEVCQIRVNGKQMPPIVFTDNYMTYEIPSAPYQRIALEFSCNFYVKNAQEKRGEEHMAMIVGIGIE